jgi:GNAT superfamily N-acetyltransferase
MLIRPLLSSERDAFCAHMLRLDKETRRLRFFRPVSDQWITAYLETYAWQRSVVLVAFCDGLLCGSAEIIASHGQPAAGEFAIAVEAAYRRRGIGGQLLAAALLRARNRGVRQLTIASLPENTALRALLAPYQPTSRFEYGVSEATLALQPADLAAVLADRQQENAAVLHHHALAVFDGLAQAAFYGRELRELWALVLDQPALQPA